ncbi:MAG: hypothetical protein AB8B97_20785 [Granulosicoccus sp.]
MTESDPIQVLWKAQDQLAAPPQLHVIKARASRFQSIVRRRNLIEYAAALIVVFFFGRDALLTDNTMTMIASVLCLMAVVYVCYKLHKLGHVAAQSEARMAENIVDFHRSELRRQHAALSSVWKWYLAPFLPGIIAYIFSSHFYNGASQSLMTGALFVALKLLLVSVVFYVIYWLNKREARRLETEIAELDKLEY